MMRWRSDDALARMRRGSRASAPGRLLARASGFRFREFGLAFANILNQPG
jgi:hypothetical protein